MKIKTANIRILKLDGKTELKSVDVKKVFKYASEWFFVHQGGHNKMWRQVTHYKTGLSAFGGKCKLADVQTKFEEEMEKGRKDLLPQAIEKALADYGAANELPEVE